MFEKKIDIDGTEKNVQVRSLKARDAQQLWSLLRSFEKLDQNDNDKLMETTDKLQEKHNELLKKYSNLKEEELEEITVDDKTEITDYFIEQAQKYVAGFSIASQKQES